MNNSKFLKCLFGAITLRHNLERCGSVQKGPLFHPSQPKGGKTPFSTGKAAVSLARGAYKEVRERERREERQTCEPEGDKGARTPLADFFNPPIVEHS
ncbi:MAG: hypothetical protein VST68_00080 [Nitrospirota bacterium]|nr:hypothetical protein [Nitrospirota bacterium]